MPIEPKRARIPFSDSTNSLRLLWLRMKDRDGQASSTIRSWVRRIGQIQQCWKPCKPHLHQAWTKPNALSCSAALSNSCSWICDHYSQCCYRKSGAGSTRARAIFLDGSYYRGKESLGCHSRGQFRLGRQENCPENLDCAKILVKILLFHEWVPGGFMWKLCFLLGIENIASAVIILWWSA